MMKGRVIRANPTPEAHTARRPDPDRTRVLQAAQQRNLVAAEEQLNAAGARAAALVAAAQEQALALEREAAARGQAAALQAVATAQEQAQRAGAAWLRRLDDELIALAVAIAEKLLGAELQLAPQRVAAIAAEVLRATSCGPPLLLRVHPDDLDHLRAALPSLQAAAQSDALTLVADASVARGGLLVEGAHARRDGQLAAQLQSVALALAGPATDATAEHHDATSS